MFRYIYIYNCVCFSRGVHNSYIESWKAAAERKGGSFIVVSIPLFMITHEFTSPCYLHVNLNFKRRGKI